MRLESDAVAARSQAVEKHATFRERGNMPHINVVTDTPSHARLYTERVTVGDFQTEHFRAQLIERLTWAVGDADTVERAHDEGDRRVSLASAARDDDGPR
jgi:hypothetical protein